MNQERGKFVFFEGNDGSGKTTLIPAVAAKIREQGYDVIETRQPDILRGAIFAPENKNDDIVQLLLFAADCRMQLRDVVIPAIDQGKLVLSDRYFPFSSYIYQRERGVPVETINAIVKIACSNINGMFPFQFRPSLGILLDVDSVTGMSRKSNSSQEKNYFDEDALKVQTNRQQLYLEEAHIQRLVIVDARRSQREVLEEVSGIIQRHGILPKEKR